MGNLCSIFHERFKKIRAIVPSARKAQLLDYILLSWQTSTYKLKNSNYKWFMKPYELIIEETGISRSSLERYIKELTEQGLIERRCALYSKTTAEGIYQVKKGTYIYVTEKLLSLIKPVDKTPEQQNNEIPPAKNNVSENQKTNECANFASNEGTDPLKMRESYIRDLYASVSINNNINLKDIKNVNKRQIWQWEQIHTFIYKEVKEEIPDAIKKLIAGTFFNLTFIAKKELTYPQQVTAEYIFALINIEHYLKNVEDFKHRNNILAKLIKNNNWKTPAGFYNHFYLGQIFKDKQLLLEEKQNQEKEAAMKTQNLTNLLGNIPENQALINLEKQMSEVVSQIEIFTAELYQASTEELILMARTKIDAKRRELEGLWEQQRILESTDFLEDCA